MDLSDYREKIDSVDKQIVKLFSERMDIAAQIAQYKKENGKPIADPVREREKLFEIAGEMSADMRAYAVSLYSLIFELSRSYQMRLTGRGGASCEEDRRGDRDDRKTLSGERGCCVSGR